MGFGVWGLGLRVWGLGFEGLLRIKDWGEYGLEFMVHCLWFMIYGVEFRVKGFGVWVWGLGYRVWGVGFRVVALSGVLGKGSQNLQPRRTY